MKRISKLAVAAAATAIFIAPAAYAGGGFFGTSITAHATAIVEVPAEVSENIPMSFGTFAANPAGSGTIDSSGNVTGGVNVVQAGNPANFDARGQANNNYTIVGDNTVTLTDPNNANPMVATLTYPASPRTLNGSGTDNFNVTGILAVGAGQGAAVYAGTYNVAVHY